MEQQFNRVAAGLEQFRQKEERFSKIFGPPILKDEAFLEQKLSFYAHLQNRYAKSTNADERLTLQILARQSAQLRKQLYPNFFQRLFKSISQALRVEKEQRSERQRSEANLAALSETVRKAGFGNLSRELSGNLEKDQQQFQLPLTQYVSQDQKMDYTLNFSRDQNGHFQLASYEAALKKENSPAAAAGQRFSPEIDAVQARNLLEGRAIYQQRNDPLASTSQGKWIQLDFNDRDAAGQYRHKEFHQGFGYTLEKELAQLNLKETKSAQLCQQLTESLKNGSRAQVTLHKEDKDIKLFIEANPQFKTLTVYDQNHQKTSLSQTQPSQARRNSIQQIPPVKNHQTNRKGVRSLHII